jgi:hypothetical protein
LSLYEVVQKITDSGIVLSDQHAHASKRLPAVLAFGHLIGNVP